MLHAGGLLVAHAQGPAESLRAQCLRALHTHAPTADAPEAMHVVQHRLCAAAQISRPLPTAYGRDATCVAVPAGRRWSLLLALVVNALFGLLSAVARSSGELMFLRLMAGVGVGGSVPVVFALLAELLPSEARWGAGWLPGWLAGWLAVGREGQLAAVVHLW